MAHFIPSSNNSPSRRKLNINEWQRLNFLENSTNKKKHFCSRTQSKSVKIVWYHICEFNLGHSCSRNNIKATKNKEALISELLSEGTWQGHISNLGMCRRDGREGKRPSTGPPRLCVKITLTIVRHSFVAVVCEINCALIYYVNIIFG